MQIVVWAIVEWLGLWSLRVPLLATRPYDPSIRLDSGQKSISKILEQIALPTKLEMLSPNEVNGPPMYDCI